MVMVGRDSAGYTYLESGNNRENRLPAFGEIFFTHPYAKHATQMEFILFSELVSRRGRMVSKFIINFENKGETIWKQMVNLIVSCDGTHQETSTSWSVTGICYLLIFGGNDDEFG